MAAALSAQHPDYTPLNLPEWEGLVRCLDFADAFLLAVLIVPDAGGETPLRALVADHAGGPSRLHYLPLKASDPPDQLAKSLLQFSGQETLIWVAAAAGEPEEAAWRNALGILNQNRNSLAAHIPGPLILAGPPALREWLRTSAPDLWSIRRAVFEMEPAVRGRRGLRSPRVFLSRATAGLKATAEKAAGILLSQGFEVIHLLDLAGSWRDLRSTVIDKLIECDAVICLVGPANARLLPEPVTGLRDPRTAGRQFSFPQLELLIARDLPRPVFTYLCSGEELIAPFPPEPAELQQHQRDFINEFIKDGASIYHSCNSWAQLQDDLQRISIPRSISGGRPSNLPYTSLGSLFKGRDSFLSGLHSRLVNESPALIRSFALSGMAAIGKTRTAIEYAWRYAEEYSALLFLTADNPDALHRSLAALSGPLVLNLPEKDARDQDIQVHAVMRWLQIHPGWLLIIDGADSDEALAAVNSLLPHLSSGHVLITSRLADFPAGITALDLDVIPVADAVAFLMERTEGRRTVKEDDTARALELARMLDGLALALEQAAAYIRHTRSSFADYIRRWQEHTGDALAWHDWMKMHYPRSLAITCETSVAQLSGEARTLLHLLSWFAPEPIPYFILEDSSFPVNARVLLAELENLHLARRREDGSAFSIHRLVQEIYRAQQSSSSPPPALLSAVYCLDACFPGDTGDVRTWPVIVPLVPHVHTAALHAAALGIPDPAARMLHRLALYYITSAQHQIAEPLIRHALALQEKQYGSVHPILSDSLNTLARLLRDTNRLTEAELIIRRALALDETAYGTDHPAVARTLYQLAALLHDTNRLAEAEPLILRALAIDEAAFGNDHPSVAAHLNNLAALLQANNRLAEAEPLMVRALVIEEAAYGKDHPNVARDLNNLAALLQGTGRLAEAEPLMHRALAIDEAAFGHDHPSVAVCLNNLAALLQATGRLAEAEPLIRRAIDIFVAFSRATGNDHPHLHTAMQNYAALLRDAGHAEPEIKDRLSTILQY